MTGSSAFFFPGQGAQSLGMGIDLIEAYPEARAVFESAREILGFDFAAVCRDGPEEELNSTRVSQPVIFLHSMAALEVLRTRPGLAPQEGNVEDGVRFGRGLPALAAAGLSLGEYSALVFAGCLEFEDALRLVWHRGAFMQKACDAEPGAMLSVLGLAPEQVDELTANARQDGLRVGVANYNSPQQVVISGAAADVLEVGTRLESAGAKRTVALKVAGAYHSELMAPATQELEPLLREVTLKPPRLPFYSNTAGARLEDPEDIREGLIRQVASSVRWQQILEGLQAEGLESAFEIGPGKVIRGLVRTVDRGVKVTPLGTCADFEKTVQDLQSHGQASS